MWLGLDPLLDSFLSTSAHGPSDCLPAEEYLPLETIPVLDDMQLRPCHDLANGHHPGKLGGIGVAENVDPVLDKTLTP